MFRTLGLGYANIGSVLMTAGIPYDSPEAMGVAGTITAIMTAESYAASPRWQNFWVHLRSMIKIAKTC